MCSKASGSTADSVESSPPDLEIGKDFLKTPEIPETKQSKVWIAYALLGGTLSGTGNMFLN